MNAEISIMQGRVFDLVSSQIKYLTDKPDHVIEDLKHEADELRHSPTFSIRTAAEINFAACTLIVEGRQSTTSKPT
jgi:hypothetical protein